MHTCHLASLVAGRVGPSPHLRLTSIRVWHAPHSLAHPLFPGVARATLVGSSITCGVCCCHPYFYGPIYRVCCCHPRICKGAPNNHSPIYCQMVVNYILYLCKRPKLLINLPNSNFPNLYYWECKEINNKKLSFGISVSVKSPFPEIE